MFHELHSVPGTKKQIQVSQIAEWTIMLSEVTMQSLIDSFTCSFLPYLLYLWIHSSISFIPSPFPTVPPSFTHTCIYRTLSHENLVEFHGIGSKGSRIFMVHSHYPNGQLSDYLTRNASLLISHPSELVNIITQILTAMVYLEQCGVVHGELVNIT